MIKKSYEYFKNIITDNYLYILFLLVMGATLTYPLPYYIYNGGGLMNVNSKIEFSGKTKSKGSYNMCYVSEIRATLPSYLLSLINKTWEREKITNVALNKNEKAEDINKREKIYLDNGNINAVITAFKNTNKDIDIIKSNPIVLYVMEEANNNLSIGDEILKVNNLDINDISDIDKALENISNGEKVDIKVKNNNKEYMKYANIFIKDNRKLLGIAIDNKIEVATNPKINFKFSNSEAGPSGGLILSLALYDYLIKEDITKGLKISGTGTIDSNGNVGEIGGVKYKLAGAVKSKANIFFVPNGDNYDEAIRIKKEKKYKIKIVGVSTFNDALNYLKNV